MNRTINVQKANFEISPELKAIHKGKAVVCLTTGDVFKSAREAANTYNLDYQTVIKCCRGDCQTAGGGRRNANKNGIKFSYVADLQYRSPDIAVELKAHFNQTKFLEGKIKELENEVERLKDENKLLIADKAQSEEKMKTIRALIS